jgi:hypothetical protein
MSWRGARRLLHRHAPPQRRGAFKLPASAKYSHAMRKREPLHASGDANATLPTIPFSPATLQREAEKWLGQQTL